MTEKQYARHLSEIKVMIFEKRFISVDMKHYKRAFNRARRRFHKSLCKEFIIN